jgi:hypothetical protein
MRSRTDESLAAMSRSRQYTLRILFLWVLLAASVCSWLQCPEIRNELSHGFVKADAYLRWRYVEHRFSRILQKVDGGRFTGEYGGTRVLCRCNSVDLYRSKITDNELVDLVRTLQWLPKQDRGGWHVFVMKRTTASGSAKETYHRVCGSWLVLDATFVSDETIDTLEREYPHVFHDMSQNASGRGRRSARGGNRLRHVDPNNPASTETNKDKQR